MNILPLNSRRCECAACHERFNSESAFDRHRAGDHGVYRYCRTPGEMRAIGMKLNEAGFWIERRRGEPRQKTGPQAYKRRSDDVGAMGMGVPS